ncbi:MAG: hypothetical protein HGA76_11685 [Candidatus Firestonebacteria bacterium]|nr:hypothetical protein [Candidatus Firestonebacteria bacterium]
MRAAEKLSVFPPAETRAGLAQMRVLASAFNDPGVVAETGKRLGADALLFGDLQMTEVRRTIKRETSVRQTGVRHETVPETGKDGKVHQVDYAYPVMEEIWRDRIQRSLQVHVEARLVRASDAVVLWQASTDWTGDSLAEEEQSGQRRGDWSSDEEFRVLQMHRAAKQLLAPLLPRVFTRVRRLAVCPDEGPYAEWIKTGNEAVLAGSWEQGGEAYLKAVSLDSARPEAYANLGVLREHQGDFSQALCDYESVSRKIPEPWTGYAREVKKIVESR